MSPQTIHAKTRYQSYVPSAVTYQYASIFCHKKINTSKPEQNEISQMTLLKYIFLNEDYHILIQILPKFKFKGLADIMSPLAQVIR